MTQPRPQTDALASLRTLWHSGAIGGLTDAQLLRRYLDRSGEPAEAAFAALVERHGPTVRRVCLAVLGDEHDAADAAQAAFLVLARRAGSIRKPNSLGPWLHGVALRLARRARSEAARRRVVERRGAERSASIARAAARPESLPCPEVHEELDRLPEPYRAPIVLCDLQGRTHQQAAEALGWPLGTVQTRLHRGRLRLRDRLARRGVAPAVLVAVASGTSQASPALPAAWTLATAHAAVRFAGRGAAIPAATAKLADGTLARLAIGRVARWMAVSLLATGLAAGAAFWGGRLGGEEAGHTEPTPRPVPAPAPAAIADEPSAPAPTELAGVVVDADGKPIAGATVRAPALRIEPEATTAADGSFRLELAEPLGDWGVTLIATAPDHRIQGLAQVDRRTHDPAEPLRIVVKEGTVLWISVRDGDAEPVADAEVEVLNQYTPIASGRTASTGILYLWVPSEAKVWWVIAKKDGVGFDYVENYRTWPATPEDESHLPEKVMLTLNGAREVTARVVDSEGRRVEGVELVPWYVKKAGKIEMANIAGASLVKATSGADGIARFPWVPADLEGPVPLLVRTNGYHCEDQPAYRSESESTEVTVPVVRDTRISGRVLEADGAPAANVRLRAEGYGDGPHNADKSAFTGRDGSFSFDLPPEKHYMIGVDGRVQAPTPAARSARGLHLREGEPIEGVELRLVPGTVIRGRVTTADGRLAAGKQVLVWEIGGEIPRNPDGSSRHYGFELLSRWADADEDGRYSLRVGPGRYLIKAPGDSTLDFDNAVAVADQEAIERDFVLDVKQTRSEVIGRVVTLEGKPVEGARVRGIGTPFTPWTRFAAESDSEGRFRAERYAEPIEVYAATPDGKLAGAVPLGEFQAVVEVPLLRSASVTGRVVDADGKPLAGVKVNLPWGLRPPADGSNYTPFYEHGTTDADGRYRFDALPVGARGEAMVVQADNYTKASQFTIEEAGDRELEEIKLSAPPKADR